MGSPFDKIISGVTTGLEFANKAQQVELQSEQLRQNQQNLDETVKKNKVATAFQAISFLEKIKNLSPKTGRSAFKHGAKQFEQVGINFDPVIVDYIYDPEQAVNFQKATTLIKEGLASGNLDLDSKMAQGIIKGMAPGKFTDLARGLSEDHDKRAATQLAAENKRSQSSADNQAAQERVETSTKSAEKIAGFKTRSAERVAGAKAIAERQKEKRANITGFRKEAAPIFKDFKGKSLTVDKILAFKGRDFNNPQVGPAIIRLGQQLSEDRNSVVNETEFKNSAEAVSLLAKVKSFFKGHVTGQKVPAEVGRAIQRLARIIKPIQAKALKRSLSPIAEQVKANGLGFSELKTVMGDHATLFGTMFGQKPKARVKDKSARKAEIRKRIPTFAEAKANFEKENNVKLTPNEDKELRKALAKLIKDNQ